MAGQRWVFLFAALFWPIPGTALGDEAVPPFALADSDGNGFVDQEEALRAGLEREAFFDADQSGDARLAAWEYRAFEFRAAMAPTDESFEQLDRDGNGVITRDEASIPLMRHWDAADRNEDGALDRSEFAAFGPSSR